MEGASMADEFAIYPSLRDKTVFITGGSTGIGSELVAAFARQGAKVGFNGRNAEAAQALIDSLPDVPHRPFFVRCDVADVAALRSSIEQTATRFGDIDVLINNVANDERHDFSQVDASYFDWMVSVNLRPHFFAIQAVVPGMKRRGGGSIINIGSISWMRKNATVVAYATLKSAAVGLTKTMARGLGHDRIRVNHLVAGWTMTEKQKTMWLDEAGERAIKEGQCLPDKVQPSDIAAMALFLAADDSRMITSQDFVVDGGWT
jgi:NAD(P)-dependent dehydrogenase (short-subunit alcohol dehydrogenase family)